MKKRIGVSLLTSVLALTALAGCGSSEAGTATASAADTTGKIQVHVATAQNSVPVSYHDDDDKLTGYDVEALRLVAEKLSDKYEFVDWNEGAQDANYTGLSTGKYDIVLSNAFYTQERAENYILTENPLGASPGGVVVRVADKGKINTLSDAAAAGYKAAPHFAGDGNTYLYQKYNAENPDNPLDFDISDDPNCFTNALIYVAEGRYDCAVYPGIYYTALVEKEDGALHEYADQLYYNEYIPISTYAVIAKGKTELAEDVNRALGELREEGKLSELAIQFYGYDTWALNDAASK